MTDSLLEQIARLEKHAQESELSKQQQRLMRLEEGNRKLQHQLKLADEKVKQLSQLNPKRMQEQVKRLQKEKQQQQIEIQQLKKQLIDFKQRYRKAEQKNQEAAAEQGQDGASTKPLWSDDSFSIYAATEDNSFKIEDINAKLTRTVTIDNEDLNIPKVKSIPASVRKQVLELHSKQEG